MRTTLTLDDELLAKALELTGVPDRSTVLHEGLKALIQRESARRLSKLGGTQPRLAPIPRRRPAGGACWLHRCSSTGVRSDRRRALVAEGSALAGAGIHTGSGCTA
jgi:Arc/MetJ family transcription regulator